jgi:hypothetical protein
LGELAATLAQVRAQLLWAFAARHVSRGVLLLMDQAAKRLARPDAGGAADNVRRLLTRALRIIAPGMLSAAAPPKPWHKARGWSDLRPLSFQPRLLRTRHAAFYLGMTITWFNEKVRPHVKVIPLGKRAIGFDRLELDAWADEYCARLGQPGRSMGAPAVPAQDAPVGGSRGMDVFERALERKLRKEQR